MLQLINFIRILRTELKLVNVKNSRDKTLGTVNFQYLDNWQVIPHVEVHPVY